MPSPQCGVVQSKLQAAVDTPPESHCSGLEAFRLFLVPSPQNSCLHSAEQPSPSATLWSSHSSPGPRMPSPHTAALHSLVQALVSMWSLSSQSSWCAPCELMRPSPQVAFLHDEGAALL